MKDVKIYYKKVCYKYTLTRDYSVQTEIYGYEIKTAFIELTINGLLTIKAGYSWDGASGPTIDTKSTLRASLIHDALFQLMRLNLIPRTYFKYANKLLKDIGIEDGMFETRAKLWEFATNKFSGAYIKSEYEPKEQSAP